MRFFLFILSFFALSPSFSQKVDRPKIVVGIVVDQMRYDYIYRYWDKYSSGGFKKLVTKGFNCSNTHYNYVPTYTGPGHASIYTGTTPSFHGIVANDWFNRSTRKGVYCADDEAVTPLAGSDKDSKMSPKNLLASTVTDELRLFYNKRSKVIGVSFKNRGAIMPAGHLANGAYWFDKKTGKWSSSTFYMTDLPKWVKEYNAKASADSVLNTQWNTLLPISKYTESTEDNTPYEALFKGKDKPVFPYDLKTLSKDNSRYDLLAATPFGNDLTAEFAMLAMQNENMGTDDTTDFMAVSFSCTDLVGHRFGPQSIEVEDTYLRLDLTLEKMINWLENKYGKENVLIFLTADHAAAQNPQYMLDNKMAAGFFNDGALYDSLKLYSLAKFGRADIIDTLINGQVYLNRTVLKERWYPINYYQERIAEYVKSFPGINNVITQSELLNTNFTEGLNSYNKRGIDYQRSGDIIFNLYPGWFEPYGWKDGKPNITGTTHGMAYSYDTHVPCLWYGWKVPVGECSRRIYITDLAPTISGLLHISQPNSCTGNPILELTDFINNQNNTSESKNGKAWNKW